MAALSYEEFKKKLRGFLGYHEDKSTRAVEARLGNALGQATQFAFAVDHATATEPVALTDVPSSVYIAQRACRLVAARFVQSISATVSLTDYSYLTLVKRASTGSVTVEMARLAMSTDSEVTGWLSLRGNDPRGTNAFALVSTSANFTLAEGDSVEVKGSANGLGCLLPNGTIVAEFS